MLALLLRAAVAGVAAFAAALSASVNIDRSAIAAALTAGIVAAVHYLTPLDTSTGVGSHGVGGGVHR